VLVNFAPTGAPQVLVRVHLPKQYRAGPILRLTAPGLRASTGVTVGGSGVSSTGAWSAAAPLPHVSGKDGAFELALPANSAALVTLYGP